jgi:hypothetical protein
MMQPEKAKIPSITIPFHKYAEFGPFYASWSIPQQKKPAALYSCWFPLRRESNV